MALYLALQAARKQRPGHVLDAATLRKARQFAGAGGLGIDQSLRCAVAVGYNSAHVSMALLGSPEWHRARRILALEEQRTP